VYDEMGDVGQALAYYHNALNILEHIGDRHNAAHFYFNLGQLYREQGDVAQARAHYEKAKALYEMVGDAQRAQRAAQALRRL
jgi:tetratricopeptide (TPR) repeat protein